MSTSCFAIGLDHLAGNPKAHGSSLFEDMAWREQAAMASWPRLRPPSLGGTSRWR